MIGDLSFSATNLKSGADADKPLNPLPGDIYVSIDTNIVYVCYVAGVWKNATPQPTTYKTGMSELLFSASGERTSSTSSTTWEVCTGASITIPLDYPIESCIVYAEFWSNDPNAKGCRIVKNGVVIASCNKADDGRGTTSLLKPIVAAPGDFFRIEMQVSSSYIMYARLFIFGTKV